MAIVTVQITKEFVEVINKTSSLQSIDTIDDCQNADTVYVEPFQTKILRAVMVRVTYDNSLLTVRDLNNFFFQDSPKKDYVWVYANNTRVPVNVAGVFPLLNPIYESIPNSLLNGQFVCPFAGNYKFSGVLTMNTHVLPPYFVILHVNKDNQSEVGFLFAYAGNNPVGYDTINIDCTVLNCGVGSTIGLSILAGTVGYFFHSDPLYNRLTIQYLNN